MQSLLSGQGESCGLRLSLYIFKFAKQGNARMTLFIALKHNSVMSSWTFSEDVPPKHEGDVHSVNIASIDTRNSFEACIQLDTPSGTCDAVQPVVGLGIATHELVEYTPELTQYLATLPAWATAVSMVESYKYVEL